MNRLLEIDPVCPEYSDDVQEEDAQAFEAGWTGLRDQMDHRWTSSGNQGCQNQGRLYCFQN
jgi:hypothetical protein